MIEIKKTKSADFQFIIKSESGKTLLESIPFSDKEALDKTLTVLRKVSSPIILFERKTNFEGKFLFNLKDQKGQTVGSSGLYSSEAGMENGIKNLKANLKDIKIK